MAEPGCEPMGDRGIQRILVEDGRIDRAGDFRFSPRYGLGFRPHARKYGLNAVKADELCIPLRGRTDKVHTASPFSPALEQLSSPPVNNAPAQSRLRTRATLAVAYSEIIPDEIGDRAPL